MIVNDNIFFEIGESVKITLLELRGFITGILIRDNNYITYEVTFFSNGDHYQLFFDDFELEKI